MDINNRESAADVTSDAGPTGSATAARMKRSVADKASEVKDNLNDLGRRAADKLEDSRQSTASALHRTASSIHTGSDQLSDFGHNAADRLQATADYVAQTDLQGIAQDVQGIVKRYPVQALAAAAVVGFLLARTLRSGD